MAYTTLDPLVECVPPEPARCYWLSLFFRLHVSPRIRISRRYSWIVVFGTIA
jgi:hypothetical protein